MASNILGKISKERTISAVVIVIAALAAILPGGIILAAVLYGVSVIGYLELTKACGVRQKTQEGMDDKRLNALEIVGVAAVTGYYAAVYVTHPGAGFLSGLPDAGFSALDIGIMISLFLSLIMMMSPEQYPDNAQTAPPPARHPRSPRQNPRQISSG